MNADDIVFSPMSATSSCRDHQISGIKQEIRVPESWLAVLGAIQNQPSWMCSTLAGGALRDLENGRSVKDVDIFVPHVKLASKMLANALSGMKISGAVFAINTSSLGNTGFPHFEFYLDGWKFEISQKTDAFDYISLLDSFDIGLCMISHNGSFFYRSSEYNKDVKNKTITVVRPTGGMEEAHAHRIQQKYMTWKIVPL